MLSFGTTSIAAYATVHHASAQAAINTMADAGLSGCVGQVLMDRNAPAELLRPAAQLLDEAARLTRVGRVVPAITPRFAISCTAELLSGSGALAAALPWPVQTHLAETHAELQTINQLFPGVAYTEVYRRSGLLTPRTLLAHVIHLAPHDRRAIAEAHSIVAHCPTANLFLNAGKMDRSAALDAGIRLTVGSDVAGGPDRSMVRVARSMLETAKRLSHRPPSAAHAWHAITAGNADELAKACGFGPGTLGGRLAPGMTADVLILRPDIRLQHSPDPLATLLYAWDDRWICHTLTAGQIRWSVSGPAKN
jgi:guanine deaminase